MDVMAVKTGVDAKFYTSYSAVPQTLVSANPVYFQNQCAHLPRTLMNNSALAFGRICVFTEPYGPHNYNLVVDKDPHGSHHPHQSLPISSKFHPLQDFSTGVTPPTNFGASHIDLLNDQHTMATFEDHDTWREEDAKLYDRGIGFSFAETHDWECPGLIDGDSGTSPTTSFNSWAAFTPPLFTNDAKDSTLTQHTADHGFPHVVDTVMPGLANNHHNVAVSPLFTGNAAASGSSPYQALSVIPSLGHWYEGMYDSRHVAPTLGGSTSDPSIYPSFGFEAPEGVASMDPFPPFDSKLASAQLAAMGHYPSEEKPRLNHDGHIVPGLLSNTVLDSYDVTRSPSSTPAMADYPRSRGATENAGRMTIVPSQRQNKATRASSGRNRIRVPLTGAARCDRDLFLLQCRNKGLSYKEIKRRGGFEEAESTLRGRIRILSKPKHERVRKPQWHHSDILLLRQAVEELATAPSAGSTTVSRNGRRSFMMFKPPWKKVSETIQKNGASYSFAPATCAKKWEQVQHMFRGVQQVL